MPLFKFKHLPSLSLNLSSSHHKIFKRSIVALSIFCISTNNVSLAITNPNEHDTSTLFSVDSAFKKDTKNKEKEEVESLFKKNEDSSIIEIKKEGNQIQMTNVPHDDGIVISNHDEEDEDNTPVVKKPLTNELMWQIAIQTNNTNYDEINDFLNKGVSVDKAVFDDGNNMLLLSAMQNRPELFKFALSHGANISYQNKAGQNVYHWISNNNSLDGLKDLLAKNNSNTLINQVDKQGKTPLHMAAIKNNLGNIDLLLKNSANIDIKDKDGRTALFYALTTNNYQAAAFLVKKGADIRITDNNGTSIEDLIVNSDISMYQMSFKLLPKDIQDKIIKSLKDAPQVIHTLVNPEVSFDKFIDMEKYGISADEEIIKS